jgi:hypothetical protein
MGCCWTIRAFRQRQIDPKTMMAPFLAKACLR